MNISVRYSMLKKAATQLQNSSRNLNNASAIVAKVAKSLNSEMEAYTVISAKLSKNADSLINISKKGIKLQKGLTNIATLYQRNEHAITDMKKSAKRKLENGVTNPVNATSGKSANNTSKEYNWEDFKKWLYSTMSAEDADKIIKGMEMAAAAYGVSLDKIRVEYLFAEASASKENGEVKADAGAGILRISVPEKKGLYSSSIEVNVGCATASALGAASLKKGLYAEASAEVKGVEVKVKRKLGIRYHNFHDEYSFVLGDANAYVKGGVSKTTIGAKIGAEAYALNAKYSKGTTLCGVKVDRFVSAKGGGGGISGGGTLSNNYGEASASIGAGVGAEAGASIDTSDADSYWKYITNKYLKKGHPTGYKGYTAGGGGYSSRDGGTGAFGGA